MLLVTVYAVFASGLLSGLGDNTKGEARRSAYTQTTATGLLFKLYKCLWREAGPGAVNGFPESEETLRALGDECWDLKIAPGGSAYGTNYDFRYLPGPRDGDGVIRSFAMATKKRSARGRWTDSYYVDHLGVYRHSVVEWATANTDRIESSKRSVVPYLLGLLDAYHDVYGAYPVRVLHISEKERADPHDLVIPKGDLTERATLPGEGDATVIDTYCARIVYSPVLAANGEAATAYTVRIRGEGKPLHDLRSYFVAADGRIHGTGEDRDATEADPVAPDIEWARGAREQTRRRVTPVLAAAHAGPT